MANIREVAKMAGVSVATVSRVLNHPEAVSDKTRKKVLDTIEEMKYTPNGIARSLALNKTSTIALLIPNILNPIYSRLAMGIEEVAHQKGYNTFLCNTEEDKEKEREYIEILLEKRVDGFILISSLLDKGDIDNFRKENIPFVIIGSDLKDLDANIVYTDYLKGAYMATQHLIEIGYKRIAHISGPFKKRDSIQKIEGFKKAMIENNLSIFEGYVIEGNNEIEGGYLGAKRLIKMKYLPEALFVANDLMAIGAMDAIKDTGLSIPKNIAVVGFDDIRMASLVEPKLTTISQPVYKMGLIGARLLIENIEDSKEDDFKQKIFLQPKLKVRKSCGHSHRIREIFN
ncbi:LacI family DNA-binding transcriptional regulator [Maledivibacter halophilus]|uniref:Transcriptional regulator, LacI family n=1 Tax=Maledivibacter halophilus TaxID=36842 RepID=A0A1T5IUJ5_9FIRM|nr:LacI family DNA-binding transcriptional regulator [Maledivibacter halophilus]SKC42593.1 transcriptional regulator, LacI family [Maledivibacter halophilus]